jgi:hypothetical protein
MEQEVHEREAAFLSPSEAGSEPDAAHRPGGPAGALTVHSGAAKRRGPALLLAGVEPLSVQVVGTLH